MSDSDALLLVRYRLVPAWAHDTTGVRVNVYGLIDQISDARRLCAAAETSESGLPPIPWVPAAIATT